MSQAFSSSAFEWLDNLDGSSREFVGNHIGAWSPGSALRLATDLQNFLIAGVGSKDNPSQDLSLERLRAFLSPLAWPLDAAQKLFDAGNLVGWNDIDMRNVIVAEMVEQAMSKGNKPIVIHTDADADYGFFAGACLAGLKSEDQALPGYIRLSPSLLTLPSTHELDSVASAMKGLATRCNQVFECLQLGVQEAINPKSAWVDASGLGINALTLAACEPDLLLLYLKNFCERSASVLVSLDLDVLGEAYAPGDHRSTSFGLSLEVLLPAIRWIAGEGKLLGLELTGIGSNIEQADRRPRLAASITQDLLSHWF